MSSKRPVIVWIDRDDVDLIEWSGWKDGDRMPQVGGQVPVPPPPPAPKDNVEIRMVHIADLWQQALRERDEAQAEVRKWQIAARTADGVMRAIEENRDAAVAQRDALRKAAQRAEGYLQWLMRHGDDNAIEYADALHEALAALEEA